MARKCSWQDKVAAARQPKKVLLDKPFAGIPAGSLLLVGTPMMMQAYINSIPAGETRTIVRLRRDLARAAKCDATCPVSTAVFIRMVAEAAIEHINEGTDLTAVAPFWRVIEPGSTIAKKLPIDREWLEARRVSEASGRPQAV